MSALFVCMVDYLQPYEKVQEMLASHREYLKKGYEKGILLASGPRNPKDGGIIIGRFRDKSEAITFSKQDPFCLNNLAQYRIFEFEPVLHSEILTSFLDKNLQK